MNLPVVDSIDDLTLKVGQASSSLRLEIYEGFENLIDTVKKSVDRILFNMELGRNTLITELQFEDANFIRYSERILNALSPLSNASLTGSGENQILGIEYQDLMLDELKKINENTYLTAEYLDLIVDTLKDNSELIKLQENMNLSTEYLDLIVDTIKDSNELEKEKFAFEKIQAIKAEEDRIEQKAVQEREEKQEVVAKEKGGFLKGILLAIAGIVTGFVVGFVDSLRKSLALASSIIKARFLDLIKTIKAPTFLKTIQFYYNSTLTTIAGVFENIFKTIKNSLAFVSSDRGIIGAIKNIVTPIKNFLVNFLRVGDAISDAGKLVVAIGGQIIKIFQGIKTFVIDLFAKVGAFLKNISGITTIFGQIGRVLGRIFFPITVLLTLFDTVKEAIAGFKAEGILGGIKGALSGFLASVVGVPLDLLKNLLSWFAEKLGFENVSKTLDSFNFVDLIKSGVKGIFQFFQDLFTDPLKAFGLDKPTELLQKAGNVFKAIFGGIVEFLATIAEFIPVKGKDIAESIRRFKPEETTATPTPSGGLSGAELQTRSQEIDTQKSAAPIVVTNAPTTVNAPTNTSMNSTTALPATSRRVRSSPIESDYRDPVFMGT
jgi:hypothetical protein